MNSKNQCLIITSTITPNSNYVYKTNPIERKKEYLDVLSYYSDNFSGDIYFTENSGYNFDEDAAFQVIFDRRNVFYVGFPKSLEDNKSKGFQEFEVVDAVVKKIENTYDEFIKVSGRYLVTNFKKLICQKNNGIIIDRHQIKKVAITSFFRCNFNIYQAYIKDAYKDVNDTKGIFIEHIIYNRLKGIDKNSIDIFGLTPLFIGTSGSNGGALNRHPLKTKLINIERMFLRWKGNKELKKEFK